MKRIICLLLCVSVILSVLTCCNSQENEKEPTVASTTEAQQTVSQNKNAEKNVVLGYNSKQSLNPFKTESTTNKNIAALMYDSLFRLDNSYNVIPSLAQSYTLAGKYLTVVLRDNLYFSDGTALSANDIIYSFNQAKTSPFYSARLSEFKTAVPFEGNVRFELNREDVYAVNCLDFPVVKSSTGSDDIPTGSGRYIFNKDGKELNLIKNESYSLSEQMEQEKISIVDISSDEAELYRLQIGDLTFMYDDMSTHSEKNKISASTVEVSLNSLVFLGINNESELFSDINMRNAVAAAVDKNDVCGSVYNSLAKPCATVFNPDWSEAEAFSKQTVSQNTALAGELLEKSGYIFAYANNEYRSKNFEFLKMTLIVGEENETRVKCARLIASQLQSVGIDAELEELPYEEYTERLAKGEFDLYVGEVKLTPNMDLSVFFSESGAAGYTIDSQSTVASAYYDMTSGKIDISTFIKVFDEYLPFVPVCYRSGVAYYSRELKYEGTVSENDMFANIYSWSLD